MALSQPANAEIVYTRTDIAIAGRSDLSYYAIDLNHDGIADFVLSAAWHRTARGSGGFSRISVLPAQGNGVIGYHGNAAVVSGGQPIDGRHKFAGKLMAWMNTYFGSDFGSGGQWKNVSDGYLGLAFKINGQIHFGWARLTMSYYDVPLKATLTGFAYETRVKTPIFAGQTSDADQLLQTIPEATVPKSMDFTPTLGHLALGSQTLDVWRRKNPAIGQQAG